jgi:carbamoyltransferase
MIVLGMSGGTSIGNQDGAASLLIDGELVAAAEEERFLGVKFANGQLPRSAIQYCLSRAGLTMRDVDAVAFPGRTYVGFRELLTRYLRHHFDHCPRLELVDHHEAHAHCAWRAWGGGDALVVAWDNSGDGRSTTIWIARGGSLKLLDEYLRPNSLGLFYSAATQFLGFLRDSDEYKVMGMAAYGRPRYDLSGVLSAADGRYEFRSDFLVGIAPGQPQPSKIVCLFEAFPIAAPRRTPGAPFQQEHFDAAASVQARLEEVGVHVVRHWLSQTGARTVCLAGGVALNCLLNQRIRELPEGVEVFVPPVSADSGLSYGAACMIAEALGDRPGRMPHAYWGPEYAQDEIREVLDRAAASYRRSEDVVRDAADLIAAGKIVGWFQGRMEFGPRALGARSILADPRRADMKDQINQRVKFREEYRPLAPAVPHARGGEFFKNYADSPFMTQTFDAAEGLRATAPAVVHEDGTSRIQSVHREANPLYADLIDAVEKRTGLPMVLNTSLNAYNDPMACAPHQALRTYFSTGMDALVLGDFILEKRAS